jgi:hypothetical protein
MKVNEYRYDRMQDEINSLQRHILNMEIAEEKRKSEDLMFLLVAFLIGMCIGIAITMVLANA